MVTKIKKVEEKICDICGERAFHTCIGCKGDFCLDHIETKGKKLEVGFGYRNSSLERFICDDCYNEKENLGLDIFKLLYLYEEYEKMRKEYKEVHDYYNKRDKILEKEIRKVLKNGIDR